MKPKCEDCRYWKPVEDDASECKRYAPKALEINLQDDAIEAVFSKGQIYAYWPRTYYDDWCGEFSPKGEECSTF